MITSDECSVGVRKKKKIGPILIDCAQLFGCTLSFTVSSFVCSYASVFCPEG